jgi:hypothetical protein
MKKLLIILTLAFLPSSALAVESIGLFFAFGDGDGSVVAYSGNGGPLFAGDLSGTNPAFGVGSHFSQLAFHSGPNLEEAIIVATDPNDTTPPLGLYRWAGGGSFALWEFVDDEGHFDPQHPEVVFSGTVDGASMVLGPRIPERGSWATGGFDIDMTITDGPEELIGRHGTAHLSVGPMQYVIVAGGNGFISNPNVGTLTLVPTPEPTTWLLLGSGLAGAGIFGRKRLARKQS